MRQQWKETASQWVPQIHTESPNCAYVLDQQHIQATHIFKYKRGPPNQLSTFPRSSHRLHTTPFPSVVRVPQTFSNVAALLLLFHFDSSFLIIYFQTLSTFPNLLVQPLLNGRGLYFSPVMCHVVHLASSLWAHFHTHFSFRDVVLFFCIAPKRSCLFLKYWSPKSSSCFVASVKLSIWSVGRIHSVRLPI